ncbi:NAD(P)/FAD-dependent oxidoreductase [bacterium]|nr:NAD(P)/FAD-dependent oxidoreductase [bacterium]
MSKAERIYPDLFKPLIIRNKRLKSRVVSSPHGEPRMLKADRDGYSIFSEDAAVYYGKIARGGAAIVNTGHLGVDPRFYLGAHREYFDFKNPRVNAYLLPSMHKIVENIHAYGSLASIELNHGGQWCTPVEGNKLIGPSYMEKEDGFIVEPMDEAEMEYVADCFAEAAYIGKRAGFDVINVHAAHNWLLGEFFSPIENQRTDGYGGSVENRARFPKMVMDRIRERVGEDMIIAMRISATEVEAGGITMEDVCRIVEIMSETVDIVQCSAGKIHDSFTESFTFPSQYMPQGTNSHLARAVKASSPNCLIETIGGIDDPAFANEMIRSGGSDLVGMARGFIADPDWVEKVKQNHPEDVRPCIRCLHCLDFCEPLDSSNSMSYCSVNPRRAFITEPMPIINYSGSKNVAVIGGGPAGMLAAIEIADRGHNVTLIEKDSKLGGRLEFADFIQFKRGIKNYREYLKRQITKRDNIKVLLNTTADGKLLDSLEPDTIIVATGASKFVPDIKGKDNKLVIHAADLFKRTDEIGNKVVVIGGGDVGCEITIQLQTMGKTVDLIETEDKLMKYSKDFWENKTFTEFFLKHEYKLDINSFDGLKEIDYVNIHLNTNCTEITDKGVYITDQDGNNSFISADTVILSTGLRNYPDAPNFDEFASNVIYIGDRAEVGNIENASRTAFASSLRV